MATGIIVIAPQISVFLFPLVSAFFKGGGNDYVGI